MFAFIFPVLLGILMGASFDDGNVTKKDFANVIKPFKKEIIVPLKKRASKIKKGFIKAVESIDAKSVPVINNLGDLS